MDPDTFPDVAVESGSRIRRVIGPTFSSLKHRNFRLYFIGQIVSNTGYWLTNVALTLLVLGLTHSGLAVGLMAACQYGPILLLSIWGGAVADRTDKRRMLQLTQTLEMLQSAALAVVAFMPHPSLAWLYILAVAGGIFLSLDNPLRRSFVSEMVPDEDVPNAVVIYSTNISLARIFGPLLAVLLIVTVGYGWCFTVDALSYLAVLACLVLMRPQELHRHPVHPRRRGEIRAGLRYMLSQPALWISFVMLTIIGTLSYNFNVTLPLFVAHGLHATNTIYTIVYAVMSIGSVGAALVVARRRLVRLNHAMAGAAALGVATLALAISPNIVTASVAVFFVGAASIVYTTSTTALVQIESKPNMRGRVLALQTVLLVGSTPVGGPLLGWLSDSLGGRAPLVLGGIAAIAAAGVGYFASQAYARRHQR